MDRADFEQRASSDWFDPAGLFVALRDDDIVGFHWTKVEHGVGEVYVVGVDPAAQGRRLGAVLTLIGLHHLAERLSESSKPTVMLYTEADNTAAVKTYEGLGFTVSNVDVAYSADARHV